MPDVIPKPTPLVPISGAVFVAVGENGLRAFSRDGLEWINQQVDRDGVLLQHVCFGQGRCLAIGKFGGDSIGWSTADGASWDAFKLNAQAYVGTYGPIFSADGLFRVIAEAGGPAPTEITSTEGKVWSARKPLTLDRKGMLGFDPSLRRVAQGNDRVVIIGDYGARLMRKTGAALFDIAPSAVAKNTLIDVAFGNGFFVGGGMHGLCMRSEDGLAWTDRTTGEEGEHINAMVWDGQQFVGVGQGATYLSKDGKAWRREPNENAPTNATFGNGVFVGTLWPGKLMRSTDGIRWKQVREFPFHVLAMSYGRLGA